MRAEKEFISKEYLDRLNNSAFFIVADYRGLTVGQFSELRKRLSGANAEVHVVKNSIFRLAAKEVGLDLAGALTGQLAVISGEQDVSGCAKVLKTFQSEFDKPKMKFGYLESDRLETDELNALADLPPLEILRGQLLGVLQAPAGNLVRLINTPASQLAQVIKAYSEKESV